MSDGHSPTVGSYKTRPQFPRDLSVALSSPHGNALMARIDQPNANKFASHKKGIEMPAMEAKSVGYT